jgi:hypothetical protein
MRLVIQIPGLCQWKSLGPPHILGAASKCKFCFKNQPKAMSSDKNPSILDQALFCISERIVSILIQPADKDKDYIASLRNEVVRISLC